ncbi:hypothetical protein JW758_00780 [Candidatus Peregrinibacteria bacterium]|nr:hypothetical protein [Candidatus Peregrinibacteria bacterium]
MKYLPEIEADMEKSERELPSIDTGYPQFNVSQIFYSPRLDTCLVDINNYYSNWNNERILMDVLTRKTIIRYVNQRDIAEFIEENDVINHEGTLEEYNERVINYK